MYPVVSAIRNVSISVSELLIFSTSGILHFSGSPGRIVPESPIWLQNSVSYDPAGMRGSPFLRNRLLQLTTINDVSF
jgi:hypothetical protein